MIRSKLQDKILFLEADLYGQSNLKFKFPFFTIFLDLEDKVNELQVLNTRGLREN